MFSDSVNVKPSHPVATGAAVRTTSVGSLLEDNFGTLMHLVSELRDLEGNTLRSVSPSEALDITAGKALD